MAERLVVLTWLWRQENGRTRYEAHHVNVWRDMIARNLTLPHEIACVTDMPEGIDRRVRIIPPPRDFEGTVIPTWTRGRPQCHRRLAMFRPDAARIFGGDVLVQLDLDIVVCGSLDPLLSGGEDFRIARGTASSRSYNGSAWRIRCGTRTKVFTEFTHDRAVQAGRKHVGSDQSWLNAVLGGKEPTWGPADGLVSWQQRHSLVRATPRLLTFPGAVKPWHLAELGSDQMLIDHYRRDRCGRALVLGYGRSLWPDVERMLARRSDFDAVIASPEAAKHWPGDLLAVADDDAHAERLAEMHGLEPVWCGRQMRGGADALAA